MTTIGSIGVLAGESIGAYSTSKHTMEAYTDSLERRMRGRPVEGWRFLRALCNRSDTPSNVLHQDAPS